MLSFVVGAMALAAVIILLGAFVLAWAWNVFVPLMWHAAPLLTYWQALALSVLLTYLRGSPVKIEKKEGK